MAGFGLRRLTWLAALLVVVACCGRAWALRVTVSAGEPVAINLEVGVPAVVHFPKRIQVIPTSAAREALSMEVVDEKLFVQLLVAGYEKTMFVITEDETVHMLTIREAPQGVVVDTQVRLLGRGRPAAADTGGVSPAALAPAAAGLPPASSAESPLRRLLVGMMRGDVGAGVRRIPMRQVLLENGDVKIETRDGYLLAGYLGMIARVENRRPEEVRLRLPEFWASGLRAIAVESEVLAPRGETVMWIVVEVPGQGG